MKRKMFTGGAGLVAASAAAAALMLVGSEGPTSAQKAHDGSAATAALQRAARAALQAHPFRIRSEQAPAGRIRTRLHLGRQAADPKVARVPDPGVDNEENSNPTSSKQLTYHTGAVQTAPHIYLVFWGANWFSGGDPYHAASRLINFYSGVGGSGWANVLKQYGSNYGSFTNPYGQYRGYLQDTTPIPVHPSQTDMVNAVLRAESRIGDTSYNAQYVIAMPWGVVDQFSDGAVNGKKACGWHRYTYVNSSQWVTYTTLPYTPYLDSLGYGCGTGWVNGSSAGILDGETINAAHEYAETVNDPSLYAWFDSDGSENADKCSWKNLTNRTLSNGMSFAVQPTWSNIWRTQYGYGCYYSN